MYPVRRSDGSFCVVVGLRIEGGHAPQIAACVRTWIADVWMPHNLTWTREWRTGADLKETNPQILKYSDEFLSAPSVSSNECAELRIHFFGNKEAKFWRDWVVSRFTPDLKANFSEIGDLLFFRNCDD
jgi:hypothetical protein